MKRFMTLILICVFLFAGPAMAYQEYDVQLSSTATTTIASGTSNMLIYKPGVLPPSGVTTVYIGNVEDDFTAVVQLGVFSGITPSVSAASSGGDISGCSFTLRYKESVVNNQQAWDAASSTNIFNGTLLSGTTMRAVEIYPSAIGYIYFEFISGITPMGQADFVFRILD